MKANFRNEQNDVTRAAIVRHLIVSAARLIVAIHCCL